MPTMKISPAMLAGITTPGGPAPVSPEALDIVNRMKDHYRSMGKASAAHNYSRHLKSFFSWCERAGYSIHNLPADAVESFLASLGAAGQKESTLYVMRTQLKSALKELGTVMGLEVHHLEYQTGKPTEVRKAQKQKEKQQRAEKRLVQTAQQLQAIQAAQTAMFGAPVQSVGAPVVTPPPVHETPELPTEEYQMNEQSAPQASGQTTHGGLAPPAPAPIVINMPAQTQRPVTTIGQNQQAQPKASNAQPQRGVVLNNHTFNGPYVRVSYIADGSSVIPAGSEVALRVYPASQLAPHGDIATFLQSYVIPEMRLPPTTAQVSFVFHELNDRKQPTGRRDDMVVSVLNPGMGANTAPAPQMAQQPVYIPSHGQMLPAQPDSMTNFLIQKLDREAEEAKKRAEALQDEMKKASDAQTTFMLMQNFQREQELRREIEERRSREYERMQSMNAPAPLPVPALPPPMPFPTILPPEPQQNVAAEIARANAESQKSLMEMMIAVMNRPQPVAPPPPVQKDVSEWLIPFIAQMNQQAQAQAQAQQQMMMQQQNQTVQILQAMLTRENPTEKLLFAQLQEVKAAANAPKADELESFADKLQKMKMVSDMLGGSSGPGILSELLANADTIGAGAAKVIQAAKAGQPTPNLAGMPAKTTTPQLPQTTQAQTNNRVIAPPPPEALEYLQTIVAGVDQNDDQTVVNTVVELIKLMLSQPENTQFPVVGRRMLASFQNAEDEGELYTLAKNLWTQLGQQYDRPAAKAVARVLARWYSTIHESIFGEPRELAEKPEENDDSGEERDEQDDAQAAGA